MRHVEKARLAMMNQMQEKGISKEECPTNFIDIENPEDTKGVAPIVKFTIQSDPISEVGVNGCQALDMLEYVKCLFESLHDAFPCQENIDTIKSLNDAIKHQHDRTANRMQRGVEGKNEA